jgi:hypothetical protein
VAAVPRLWTPDLVPFGSRQAALVAELATWPGASWWEVYTRPSTALAAFASWLSGGVVSSVTTWVVVRGLLDALTCAVLYLATRRQFGRGAAVLAALLYAVSPAAWAAARDPAGSVAPLWLVTCLLASVWLAERVTLVRAAAFGLVLVSGAGPIIGSRPGDFAVDAPAAWHALLGVGRIADANVPPGGLVLPDLVLPGGILALLLAVVGVCATVVHARRGEMRLLVFPAWAGLGLFWLAVVPGSGALPAVLLPLVALIAAPVGLVTRAPARWAAGLAIAALIGLGAVTVGLNLATVEAAERSRAAFDPATIDADRSLRAWQALARTVERAAGRVDTSEVVSLDGGGAIATAPMLDALLSERVRVRRLPADTWVLPLEDEILLLVLPGTEPPVEMIRPSSRLAVVEAPETDTGARLVTLRARPSVDWLARTDAVQGGLFADGSALVGVATERSENGRPAITLFWDLPASGEGRASGLVTRVTASGTVHDSALPSVEARRDNEIVVQRIMSPGGASTASDGRVSVALLDASARPIPTADGAAEIVVRAGRVP